VIRVSDCMTVLQNRAATDLVNIHARKNVTISYRISDTLEKVVSIEERDIPDLGLHQVALEQLYSLDQEEIKMRMDNARKALEVE